MEDIRLSDEVDELREKNWAYLESKLNRLSDKVKKLIDEEFDWMYDESCIYAIYARKGNDVNSCQAELRVWNTVSTTVDTSWFQDMIRNMWMVSPE